MSFNPYGIVPAMITPFTSDGKNVNEKVLRELIEYLINGGVHGIFAAGTSGEFYALNDADYKRVLEVSREQIAGRVPLYAGASSITTNETIRLAKIAESIGADVLSVLTPMFVSPSQDEIYEHYKAIAQSVNIPIIAYNNRPKTGVHIEPRTAVRMAAIDNIVGIKDSTGDMTNAGEYIRLTKGMNFHVMMGRDTMVYAALCYGAAGAVATCGNVAPALMVKIYDCFKAGDHKGALEAQYKLAPLRIAVGMGTFPIVIKEALQMLGIDAGPCVGPIGPLSQEERGKLKEVLIGMGLL